MNDFTITTLECPQCGKSIQKLKARKGKTLPIYYVPGNASHVKTLVYCSACGYHHEKKER